MKKIISNKKNVIFTISHQINILLDNETKEYIEYIKKLNNIIYSEINSTGVAKNRNNSLKYRVKGSICLLADDDVIYFDDAFKNILNTFEKEKSIDILTFKIKTFSGRDYKNYKNYGFRQNIKTLSNIGIIDVAFREEIIDKYDLIFDERFGPGGYYSIGEDFIFMTDAIKKGLNIQYRPIDIVQHEDIGTGQILRDDIIFGRGAMFARVFGYLSFLLNIFFSTKNYKRYSSVFSYLKYNILLFKGSWSFLKEEKNGK